MIQHEKVDKSEFQPGATYSVSMNGVPLYVAQVVKFHGGCWATVRVQQCLNDELLSYYQPGTEFDIKVAQYTIEPFQAELNNS